MTEARKGNVIGCDNDSRIRSKLKLSKTLDGSFTWIDIVLNSNVGSCKLNLGGVDDITPKENLVPGTFYDVGGVTRRVTGLASRFNTGDDLPIMCNEDYLTCPQIWTDGGLGLCDDSTQVGGISGSDGPVDKQIDVTFINVYRRVRELHSATNCEATGMISVYMCE